MLRIIWNRFLKIKLGKQFHLGWFQKRWMSLLVLLITSLKRLGFIVYQIMIPNRDPQTASSSSILFAPWIPDPESDFYSLKILEKDWTILHYFISFGSAKDVSNLLCRDDFQPCLKTGSFLPLLFLPECPESAQKKSLIKKYLLKKNFDIRKVFNSSQPPTQPHA